MEKILVLEDKGLTEQKKYEDVGDKVFVAVSLCMNSINEYINNEWKEFKFEHNKEIVKNEIVDRFVVHFKKRNEWKYVEFFIRSDGNCYSIEK